MMTEQKNKQTRMLCVCMEDLVPQGHFLRKLDAAVDFTFIYDIMRPLYSNTGRPSIDPVVLVKMLLIGYLYGIDSERKLEQEITVNIAYRWFLGLDLEDSVPDHSVFSQNRKRRFKDAEVFQEIFHAVVIKCAEVGLVEGKCIVMDSTHIKANADNGNAESVLLMEGPSEYWQKLNDEYGQRIRQKREDANVIMTMKKKSISDPEAGWMGRLTKPKGFHYLCHQSSDTRLGIITDVHVTAGDVADADHCVERMAYQKHKLGLPIRWAGLDCGYDPVFVHHGLKELGITGMIPDRLKNTVRKNAGLFTLDDFQYDGENDRYICPNKQILSYCCPVKEEYRIQKLYQAKNSSCGPCPYRTKCISSKNPCKKIRRYYHQEDREANKKKVGTFLYREIMKRRKCICEGNFALQKRCHNLKFTRKRGIEKVREQCLLSATVLNLKRLVKYGAAPLRLAAISIHSILTTLLQGIFRYCLC